MTYRIFQLGAFSDFSNSQLLILFIHLVKVFCCPLHPSQRLLGGIKSVNHLTKPRTSERLPRHAGLVTGPSLIRRLESLGRFRKFHTPGLQLFQLNQNLWDVPQSLVFLINLFIFNTSQAIPMYSQGSLSLAFTL